MPTSASANAPALPAIGSIDHGHRTGPRLVAIDYLRSFITLLVVAHHAVLAYHPYAPSPASFSGENLLWSAFPIVDARHWAGVDLFVGFNDTFFMSLMFLLSGLFVWPGIQRKGAGAYLRERGRRLGVPFLVSVLVLAPLAYYPAWLQRGGAPGLGGFAQAWLGLGVWPAGPAWFLWVLLAFDALAALLWRIAPGAVGAAGKFLATRSPAAFSGWTALIAVAGYVPLAASVDTSAWSSFGPYFVQTSRIALYLGFFAIGVGVGAWGVERSVIAADDGLAHRWLLWSQLAPGAFFLLVALFITLLTLGARGQSITGLETATSIAFAVSCTASSIAFLSLFLRFARKRRAVFDSLARNAYGIYLVHYVVVTWLQFSLLPADWPGALKGSVVCITAWASSWAIAATLRRIGWIARII